MQGPLIIHPDSIVTFLRPFGRELDIRVGDIVKAEVINLLASGDVALRISRNSGDKGLIVARSNVPLTKGTTIYLRMSATDSEVRLQYMGDAFVRSKGAGMPAPEALPGHIAKLLSKLAGSQLKQADISLMEATLKALPGGLKAAAPGLRALEGLMPEVGKLNAEMLRKSVEDSGLLFETKLRMAAQDQAGGTERLSSLLSGHDFKLELLRLKTAVQDHQMAEALRGSGLNPADVSAAADKLIRNLEYFQITSYLKDSIYTFLPLAWQELREGELSFRKNRDGKDESYSCDINLDLHPAGRLSVSVTLYNNAFYVTFHAEDEGITSLVEEARGALEERFSAAGLSLMAVNISRRNEIPFGAKAEQGLNIRV